MANQKFDALFGGPAPQNEESSKVDIETVMVDGLAPTDQNRGQRKQSNVDQTQETAKRKESNTSANSGNRQLSALFPKDNNAAVPSKPRKRYTKEEMLAKFKQTSELDMNVFNAELISACSDLLIDAGVVK